MSKATEKELSDLHAVVANVLVASLSQNNEAERLLNIYGSELPEEVQDLLKRVKTPSPAILQAATKFLKDNSITCDAQSDTGLQSLQEKLNSRKSVANLTIAVDNT